MSWVDQLTEASFRGVPFEVATDERSGGRDGASHSTPGSNGVPYVEDTGIKGRVFTLDGYFVGDDCFSRRDALLDALETEGSGDLAHPSYGVVRVAVQSYSSKYNSKSGGLVVVSMTFAETSAEPLFASDTLSPSGTVDAAATELRTQSLAQFLAQYVAVPYSAEMTTLLTALSQQVQQIMAVKAIADESAASVWRQAVELSADAAALLAQPATLALSVRGLVASLASGIKTVTSGLAPWTTLLQLCTADYGTRPDDNTPDGLEAATSYDALRTLVLREALDQSAGLVTSATHESYEDAVAARDGVTDQIDDYCDSVTDDTYDALTGLRRALCQAVPPPDETLPHLEIVQIPNTLPSLVLSYTLYGDLDHEDSILRRNKVKDPTYLPGGQPLEVLSR